MYTQTHRFGTDHRIPSDWWLMLCAGMPTFSERLIRLLMKPDTQFRHKSVYLKAVAVAREHVGSDSFHGHPVVKQALFLYCSLISRQLATGKKIMPVRPPGALRLADLCLTIQNLLSL